MMTTACESRKKQTREEDAPEGIHNLTDDLLTEILLRLSRRQALQYRLVCKGWYSIISSPRFTRLSNLRLGFPINLVFQTPGFLVAGAHYYVCNPVKEQWISLPPAPPVPRCVFCAAGLLNAEAIKQQKASRVLLTPSSWC
ncbi:unnamed protein product [Cuscuta epithymum]|uniref:F-box domain-containing protein n=1 Tax=Cuscuta epithymum TaxID=186058 RepID=A0AAV0FQX8_9ASTE|nr:unnamed protein product [Cuscuta epithymum]